MAATVATIERDLSQYVRSDYKFLDTLNLVLPRLYGLGYWKDLVYEDAIITDHHYFALPREAEAPLAIMVDDSPVGMRSQWQDFRTSGLTSTGPAPIYGAVDDGYAPTIVDLSTAETYQISVVPVTPYAVLPAEGFVRVMYTREDDEVIEHIFELNGSASLTTAEGVDEKVVSVEQIIFDGVPVMVHVKAIADSVDGIDLSLARGRGDEVSRYRRFRVANYTREEKTIRMLLKRRFEPLQAAHDIVWLSDRNVLKHGILASVAEDNADLERANYHWAVCEKLLDNEKAAQRGMIRPTVNIDFFSGAGEPTPCLL